MRCLKRFKKVKRKTSFGNSKHFQKNSGGFVPVLQQGSALYSHGDLQSRPDLQLCSTFSFSISTIVSELKEFGNETIINIAECYGNTSNQRASIVDPVSLVTQYKAYKMFVLKRRRVGECQKC